MTDQNEQQQSWRDRLFGTEPEPTPDAAPGADAPDADTAQAPADEPAVQTPEEALDAPDAAVDAAGAGEQPAGADSQRAWQAEFDGADADKTDEYRPSPASVPSPEADVEPQVVLPSSLRGSNPTGEMDQVEEAAEPEASPELVEPVRPQLSLRRRERAIEDAREAELAVSGADASSLLDDADQRATGEPEAAAPEADAAEAAPAAPAGDADALDQPTQAMPAVGTEPEPAAETRVLDEQDFVTPAPAAHVVDEAIFVEQPEEPRKRGARGVGSSIALLSTLVFAGLFGLAIYGVAYLFTADFDPALITQVWVEPSFVFGAVAFLVGYLLLALIVNRAGWWAHVLGGFIVAALVYAAAVWGLMYASQGGWATGFGGLFELSLPALRDAVLAPTAIVAFILAREVPIWLGGIVARRGRTQRRRYEAELEEHRRRIDEETD